MRYQFIRFPGGKPKAVTFSYDDGCDADARFSQLLTSYGLKGTFNLNNDVLRKGSGLTENQVKELILDKGHEVAVHGEMHIAPGNARAIVGITDVLNCRLELEQKYGRIIRGMAYPDSGITRFANESSYETIKNYLKDLGIVYSRTLAGDNNLFRLPTDWHAWMPTMHHNNPNALEYVKEFVDLDFSEKLYGAARDARLFYVWGHSYEFDRNDNWDHAEQLCKALSGHDDVWYATNIEIYEYTNAYHSLIYSADNKTVYNPTLYDIWFEVDTKLHTIRSGETLRIEE